MYFNTFTRDLALGAGPSLIVGLPFRPATLDLRANVNDTRACSIGGGNGVDKHGVIYFFGDSETCRNTPADILLSFGSTGYCGGPAFSTANGFRVDWTFSNPLTGTALVIFYASKDEDAALAKSVIFMGDSLTAQWPMTCYGASMNKGVSGNETSDMLARFSADVIAHAPDQVVILGGTNDTTRHTGATVSSIAGMANAAIAAGITPILCQIPPVPTSIQLTPTTTWNAAIVALASSLNVPCIDYYTPMMSGGSRNESLFNSGGDTHPNQAGYAVMTTALTGYL